MKNKLILGTMVMTFGLTLTPESKADSGSSQRITSITKRGDGSIQLNCLGSAGSTYMVQAAGACQSGTWSAIGTNVAASDGTFSFVDTSAGNCAQRFYRTVLTASPSNPGLFTNGLVAKGVITITGSPVLDSFLSANTNYSTGGMYDPAKAMAQITVATDSDANPAIKVAGAKIYGYAQTGPSGTLSFAAGGAVGDAAWINATNTGAETGHSSHSGNITIVDAPVPFTSGAAIGGGVSFGGTNYTSVLTAGTNYHAGSYTINGGQSLLVTNNAWLYVAGSFTTSGSGFIYVAPGASLKLYVGSTNASGSDSIKLTGMSGANGNGKASSMCIVGLPSVKTVTSTGSQTFVGTIYAPSAAVTLNSGVGCIGAVVANTISLSGNFHYDGSLTNLLGL